MLTCQYFHMNGIVAERFYLGAILENIVLIPMDDSRESMAALRQACSHARHASCRLCLLHVIEPKETGDLLGIATGASSHSMDKEDFFRAEARLEAWWKRVEDPGAPTDMVIRCGRVAEVIAEEAYRLHATVIIMGASKSVLDMLGRHPGTMCEKVKKLTGCGLVAVDEERTYPIR